MAIDKIEPIVVGVLVSILFVSITRLVVKLVVVVGRLLVTPFQFLLSLSVLYYYSHCPLCLF